MAKEIILKVENLTVEIAGESVLENLSFKVEAGDVLTILGPNGAGKTVLLKTLLGILPFKGSIEWKQGVRIGYVPQRLPFIKDIPMSVSEFLSLKNASRNKIKEVLISIGLPRDILQKKVGALSSGQFQRILVGWALVSNPNVLLFDEPTTGVDMGGQESIYNFLEKLNKDKAITILLVTHDLSLVYTMASDCLCLNKKMLCYSIPKELTPERLAQLYGGQVKLYEHTHQ